MTANKEERFRMDVVATTSDSVSLRWNRPAGRDYYFEYEPFPMGEKLGFDTQKNEVMLVLEQMLYHFRVVDKGAQVRAGTTGGPLKDPPPETKPPKPKHIDMIFFNDGSRGQCSWPAVPGAGVRYTLKYYSIAKPDDVKTVETTEREVDLEGLALKPFGIHAFELTATTKGGTSEPAVLLTSTNFEELPSPVRFGRSSATSQSITLTWDPLQGGDIGLLTHDRTEHIDTVEGTTITYENLPPNTYFRIRAQAVNKNNIASIPQYKIVSTSED
ncbi:hypothetical protein ACI77F_24670 [Pseudomonas tritici]|uniref:hypothetical protein n=1 Tax=Pseudomonas tritici TaxID=2745518 RepID=UPI00387A9A2F